MSCALLAYLFTDVLPAGDGAVYLAQAQKGDLAARTIHLGYLLQLTPLVHLAGDAAGALLSCLWALAALVAAWTGAQALTGSWRTALVAPAALMGMSAFWTHALFPEVYGPAAAAVLISAALRLRGHAIPAGLAAGVAATMHPGALVWLVTLAWIGEQRVRFLIPALLLPAAAALVAPADYWASERGVLGVLAWPRPWLSAQRAYRMALDAAPLAAALMLLGLADRGPRRRLGLPLLPGLVLAWLTDWRDDVPAMLPALFLAALLVPSGLEVLRRRLPRPRLVLAVVALVLAFQIGEATSRHDRERRRAVREVEALRAVPGEPAAPLPWGSFGERARYDHYVPDAAGPAHVMLPPGVPYPPGACPDQHALPAGELQLFLCPGRPAGDTP